MSSYDYVTVNVFTDHGLGGNPLAVFADARGLSDAQMQAIAADLNLSETTFVLPPDNPQHHARVRIFTPRAEMPFAGHPNVGTGFVLARQTARLPDHFTFEEAAGLVRVHPQRDPDGTIGGAWLSAPHALQIGLGLSVATVAACAGLEDEAFLTNAHDPLVASVGTEFVLAELADIDGLVRAIPNEGAFEEAVAACPDLHGRLSLCLYVREGGDATKLRMRMFAPLLGVPEDPATGSAAATLAALLVSLAPGENVDLTFDICQGAELGCPSRLIASARKTAEGPVTATVGGSCVPVTAAKYDI